MTVKASKQQRTPRRDVGRRVADDILTGFKSIVADMQGDKPLPGRKHVVHVIDIKALRKKLRVSQAEFAER